MRATRLPLRSAACLLVTLAVLAGAAPALAEPVPTDGPTVATETPSPTDQATEGATEGATDEATEGATDETTERASDEAAGAQPSTASVAQQAAAAAAEGCGYGEGGENADTICWLDMSGYDDAAARSDAGQDMTVTLSGGYTLSFNIKTRQIEGGPTGVESRAVPIETRFAFGTEAYRDIPGKPSLYSLPSGRMTLESTLSGIRLEDANGAPVTSYSFVASDTEDNISGESLVWTSDKRLELLEVLYDRGSKGCKPASMTGFGTTSVTCNGVGGASTLGEKSTSVLVSADSPSTFALRWSTAARSGIAFGINTATIEVTKTVDGRTEPTDSFDVSITSPEGSTLATASTGTADTATTGPVVVIPSTGGGAFTLTDAVTPGSGADMTNYGRSWSCTLNGQPDPTLPSGSAPTVQVSPGANESIACTVTNRAAELPTVTCETDADLFNTAHDGAGGRLPAGSRDLHWQAGLGDASGPTSVPSWIPAWVTGRAVSAWTPSRSAGADWISYFGNGGQGSGNVDVYFRHRFRIDPAVSLDGFALPMDFYADNSVPEVWVNGVAQSDFEDTLPQSSNHYFHTGFVEANRARTVLSNGFRHGFNTVVVRVASGAPQVGFMAEITSSPLCSDAGDAPASFGTAKSDGGATHGLPGYDADTATAALMLGATTDADVDGAPGAAADGDDTTAVDDEDALADAPTFQSDATSASLDVAVTNTGGSAATLHGWVDADLDGAFGADEHASAAVPTGATSATLDWVGLPPLVDGSEPYVRLRLTTADLVDDAATPVDERSRGAAPDGEVEDHRGVVGAVLSDGCATPYVEDFGTGPNYGGPLPAGQTTYGWISGGTVTDGNYTLASALPGNMGSWWHTGGDHTAGDTDGRMMLVNATVGQTDQFFQRTFHGLVAGARYDFSAWVTNAGASGTIQPNVKFRVVDGRTGTTIAETDSGDIPFNPRGDGIVWRRFGLQFEATAPTVRLEIVNNAPGGSGNDLAIDDIGFNLACDWGDAPASYGTLAADDGPVHRLAGPRLGAERDGEADGLPSTAADGDDTTGTDDEDGVAFNPDLGYPEATIRTGPDPVTLEPVVNHLTVDASDDGFVSVWVDWNRDGDFADPGEQVAAAQPVTAGDNDVTFSRAANPDGIRTHVRVRFSTDAAAVQDPTGPAPDGEVEDYRVLVERLVTPAACSPVTEPYYAMTFTSVVDQTGGGGAGTTARFPGVSVVGGEVVDMIATTAGNSINPNGFFVAGDDAAWNLNPGGAAVSVTFSWVRSGTTTPVPMNSIWTINDMDSGERTDFFQPIPVAGYAITPGSQVQVSEDAGRLVFRGTVSGNGDVRSRWQAWFQGRTQVTAVWRGFGNSGFLVDGDNDLAVPKSCDDYGDAPDSYGTLLGSDGPRHTVTPGLRMGADSEFDSDGQPGPEANGDDLNRNDDEDGVGSRIEMTPGEPTTVEVTATNDTGAAATLAAWLDTDGDGTFDDGERVVVPVGAGTATYSLTFPAGPVDTTTAYARFRLFPGVLTDPRPTGAATAGEVEDHPVVVLPRALEVDKQSTATADTRAGDTVTYTVTATNTGEGAFTETNPARVVDDLTAVLDDAAWDGVVTATVDGEPAGSAVFTSPRLLWSGALDVGETVEITYTVTLQGGGDGVVRNVAWAPPVGSPPGRTPDCGDPTTAVPCDTEELLLPRLDVVKRSSHTAVPATGELVTYTVEVTNVGPGDYTAGAPATFVDDLTEVLDDAVVEGPITASVGDATYDEPELSWTGVLAAGDAPATIRYQVRYTGAGDQLLDNSACVPSGQALDPALACATTTTPGSGLDQAKTASPAAGTSVDPGDEITYTLRFTNTGETAATVDTVDDLSGVVDDADLLVGSIAADPGLTATYEEGTQRLVVSGSVPVGETLLVRYTVEVRAFGAQDDHVLRNALACQPGDPAPCAADVTEHPVRSLAVKKTSDATADSRPGDVVAYELTVQNVGPGAYTVEDPAVVLDTLAAVLDDADWNGDAAAASGGTAVGAPVFDEPRLRWVGALVSGGTVRITYSVTLTGGGDGSVLNVAFVPGCNPGASGCNPPVPECSNGTDPATGLACAPSLLELPKLEVTKATDVPDVRAVGDVVTYTVTVRNVGGGDYTVSSPASLTDDLADVLDDAELVPGSVTGGAAVVDGELHWSGPLPAGAEHTVTYAVRYTGAGDRDLVNRVCVPADEAAVVADACRTTETPGSGLVQSKTAAPADAAAVEPGDEITYTLTFDNTAGRVPARVDTVDDLSDVLDDAVLTGGPTAADGLSAGLPDGDGLLRVTGSVPAGERAVVSYVVTVRPYAQQGDHVLRNALACQPGEPAGCRPEVTEHPVRHLRLTKTSDAATGIDTGDRVTYTVTVRNDGPGAYAVADPASAVDDLSDVLDDATLDPDDVVVDGGGSFELTGTDLVWTGPLAAGAEVTITYTVTVTNLGDHDLVNAVSGVRCDAGDDACAPPPVETPLPHVVPDKTADPAAGTGLAEGDEVTYTLSWHNDGQAAGVVDATDDLTGVLDDAELVDGPTSTAVGVTATVTDGELRVTGPVAVDETVTVTYRVRVLPDGERGDNLLGNLLAQDTPQVECGNGGCVPVDPPVTEHRIGELTDRKGADPAGGRSVASGDRITYTLTFTNTGTADVAVARDDVLSGVLDDAVLVRAPRSSDPALGVSPVSGGRFTVTGVLVPGQTVTVTYAVRVKPMHRQGDRVIANALLDQGEDPGRRCADGADATCHRVERHDLTIDKRVVGGTRVTVGDRVRYRIQVANRGPDAAPGPIRVVDDLPRGLQLQSARGKGWDCRVRKGADVAVCVREKALGQGRKAAPVFVTATTTKAVVGRRVVNTAVIEGSPDTRVRNDRDTARIRVVKVPPLPSTGFRWGHLPRGPYRP